MSDSLRIDDLLPADAPAAIARQLGLPTAHAALALTARADRPNGTVAEATLSAGSSVQRLVIKRLPPGWREAGAYRCLRAAGAPVAQLHASFTMEGRETVVLERLPRIGHDNTDDEFARIIAALARMNAVAPAQLDAPRHGWLARQLGFWRRSAALAIAGAYGPALADAASPLEGAWDDLDRLAQGMEAELMTYPLAATHHDPCLGNCGWTEDGEARFIDLTSASLHPLLCDLAVKLGASADPWPSARGREHWLALYAASYERAGGQPLGAARLSRGLGLQIAAHALWLDSTTWGRGDAALRAQRPADCAHGGAWWYARTWRRLLAMRSDGIAGAGVA
jgi:hypothetical protein